LYTQKPAAWSRMAWCRPPAMLTARSASPDAIRRAASNDPPTIVGASAQTNGQLTAETSLRISDPNGDKIHSEGCVSGSDYSAELRAPYSEDPDWELEVTVSPELVDWAVTGSLIILWFGGHSFSGPTRVTVPSVAPVVEFLQVN